MTRDGASESFVETGRPRFGVWALVRGTMASRSHPDERVDASWERNRRQILEAERLGYESTLVAQHTLNPMDESLAQLEAWTAAAALGALTDRIEIITAVKPYLYHPVVFAKMALQIEEITQGRLGINLVNAWYAPELDKAGIGFPDHEQRYEYGREWATIVSELISGRRTTFSGDHFQISDYELRPASRFRARPAIYLGGESESALALAVDRADVLFINAQPPEKVGALIRNAASRARQGEPLRFGLSAFVIARETSAEADDELTYAWELAARDNALGFRSGAADPKAVMFQTFQKHPAIGTNGGTAAGLVGGYDEVAERIHRFNATGVETFMLQFQPFEAEMERFAREVIPRVRRLEARSAGGSKVGHPLS